MRPLRFAAALAVAACALGPSGNASAGSGAPPSKRLGTTSDTGDTMRALPAEERKRLGAALRAALAAVPSPGRTHAPDPEQPAIELDDRAPWDVSARRWLAPAAAAAGRYHEAKAVAGAEGPEPADVEVRVELNGAWRVTDELATVGDAPALIQVDGATAVEVATIAPESPGGRVALPLDPAAAEERLAVVRLYLGPEEMERAIRRQVEEGRPPGLAASSPVTRPGDVRWLTVRLHGPKRTVETMARATKIVRLRRLLTK